MIRESFKRLFPDMKKGIERFPLTVIMGITVFIMSVLAIEDFSPAFKDFEEWLKYFIIIIPFTASLELVREKYFEGENELYFNVAGFIGLIILIAGLRMLFISFFMGEWINIFATGTIFYMLFYFVPLNYRKENREKYVQSVVVNLITAIEFSLVLFLGIVAIIGAVDLLLVEISNTVYMHAFSFSASVFGVIFFLSRLKGKDESLESYSLSKITEVLICYILIPLILIYTAVLYLYFLKILFTLKMPKGIVSHLVLWYTTLALFVIIMVVPITDRNKFAKMYRKYFPMISVPLILLAFFSISERIMQYGVTENRYMIAVLIIWLLFNMAMYIAKKGDVKIVVISYILAVFVTVFSPYNMGRVSRNSQLRRLEKLLEANGFVKDGKIVRNDRASHEAKNDIHSVVSYFRYSRYNRKDNKIELFEKTYGNAEEMAKEIGVDESWHSNPSSYVSNIFLKPEELDFIVIKNYSYYINSIHFSLSDGSADELKKDGIEVKIDNRSGNLKIFKNEEILNIDLARISKEVYDRLKPKFGIIEYSKEFGEQDLTYKGETEKAEYKIVFREIRLEEKDKISGFIVDIYFKEKR